MEYTQIRYNILKQSIFQLSSSSKFSCHIYDSALIQSYRLIQLKYLLGSDKVPGTRNKRWKKWLHSGSHREYFPYFGYVSVLSSLSDPIKQPYLPERLTKDKRATVVPTSLDRKWTNLVGSRLEKVENIPALSQTYHTVLSKQ